MKILLYTYRYFDEEFWPGPRTGEVSAKKAFEDDMSLIKSFGYRKTKCNTQHHVNSTTSNTKSKTLNTPWGKIVKPTKSEFLGMVEIQMSFDYNANILYVTIIQAKNLKSFSGNIAKPDAFILGYILPHRTMVGNQVKLGFCFNIFFLNIYFKRKKNQSM